MEELAKGEREFIDWINAAKALHSNFYHNWMEEKAFEDNVRKVISLLFWLIKILDETIEKMS